MEKAAQMRAELDKVAEKVRDNEQVKKAMAMYDEQVAKLRAAADSEAAQKVFDVLVKAKEMLVKAIETAVNSPLGQKVVEKLADYQNQAKAKLEDLKAQGTAKLGMKPAVEAEAKAA